MTLIALTGATGFIGRQLLAELPNRGYRIRVLLRRPAQVPLDFDGTFRQVVRHRLEWSLREGHELYPTAVALWNSVR